MKPLLPRVNSYLVPIQFPLSQPLVLQPSVKIPLSMAQGASLNSSETLQSNKRVHIATKVGFLFSEEFFLGLLFFYCFFKGGKGWAREVVRFVFFLGGVCLFGFFVYFFFFYISCLQ